MLEEQDYRCGVCDGGPLLREGRSRWSSHIDHCHDCGEVRRLLCKRCNALVGFIESDPKAFKKALLFYVDHQLDVAHKSARKPETDQPPTSPAPPSPVAS